MAWFSGLQRSIVKPPAKKAAPKPAPKPAPYTPPAPQVVYSPPPVTDPTQYQYDLAYDSQLADEEGAAYSDFNDAATQAAIDDSAAQLDWTNTTKGINDQAPAIYRRLLNDSAARGLAYSTGYQNQQSEAQNSIANSLSQADSSRAARLAANQQRRAAAEARRNERLASIARRRAARQS